MDTADQSNTIERVCTFFGHRDAPDTVVPLLEQAIVSLIQNESVSYFLLGNQGGFDGKVRRVLKKLQEQYPYIQYNVVLAYMPGERNEFDITDYTDTIFPEGLESVPRRFAIARRNDWMLKRADFVITYVLHRGGGAAQFAEKAIRQGKTVINLANKNKI